MPPWPRAGAHLRLAGFIVAEHARGPLALDDSVLDRATDVTFERHISAEAVGALREFLWNPDRSMLGAHARRRYTAGRALVAPMRPAHRPRSW